jgi:hypothetical protein
VRTVCVDMTESVPVKLSNRGTLQAIGLVTDVGYFLERLGEELRAPQTSREREAGANGRRPSARARRRSGRARKPRR